MHSQTRVLVTHGLGYLPQCDIIVTLENGRISEIGAYAELIDNNGAFAEFIRTYASTEDSDEEGDPGKGNVFLWNNTSLINIFIVMSEYKESEADELPLTDNPTTPMTPSDEVRKDVYRRFLERQRSQEYNKELALTMPYQYVHDAFKYF